MGRFCLNLMLSGWLVLALIAVPCSGAVEGAAAGEKVQGFQARDCDGKELSLEELLREKPLVLLSFWGLRCGACIEEIPHLNKIHAERGTKISVIGVNIDGIGAATLKDHMAKMPVQIEYRVIPDPELAMADLFQLMAAPLTILIDSSGTVRYRHEGFASGDEAVLDGAIRKALGK